jgi:ribosomal protein S18 acetylase RimI-like enzyme
MLVRAFTPGDARSFQSLRLFALEESPASFASTYDEEKNRSLDDVIERIKATDRQAVFGAFIDERLIGMAGVRRDFLPEHRHKAHLWGMYVAPDARGAGVSRLLAAQAIDCARHMPGVTQMHLNVAAKNTVAIRLYRSLGFEALERESRSIFGGDDLRLCLRFG